MRIWLSARLQRTAFVAVFALVSHALLPYLHALESPCGAAHGVCTSAEHAGQTAPTDGGPRSSHPDDCPVCSALAHGGARAVDAPIALTIDCESLSIAHVRSDSVVAAPIADVDVAPARAPPAFPRAA
ncbi:MAG TPA: hypothetical protein VMR31_05465 [Myxococcota bacterium]|nr:hypothetical protein [Myxococcota bacterium]